MEMKFIIFLNPMDYTRFVDWGRNLGDHLRILPNTGLCFENLKEHSPVAEMEKAGTTQKRDKE